MSEPKTMQETIDEISKVAEARGDAFITKVMRRNSVSDMQPELWFQAGGASARMIADKEIWLTSLIGDGCGVFDLIAFHETEPMRPIGAPLRINKSGDIRRDPNIDLLKSNDWNGPRTLMHPRVKPKVAQPEMTTIGANGMASAIATGPQIAFTPAVAVTPGQAKREIDTVDMIAQKRTMEALAQLEAERAKLDAEKAIMAEQRRQLEMRSTVEPLQRQIEELKSAITTARAAPVVETPKKSLIEEITPLIAAFAPLYLKSKEQDEAKTNLMIQQMKESSERQAQMFKDIMEKTASKSDGLSEVTTKMAEVMGTVGNMVVQMAHQMKTLQEPAPEQSALVTFAEAISKPLDKVATAFLLKEQRATRTVDASSKALPPKPVNSDVNKQIEEQRATEEEDDSSVDPAEIPNVIALGQMITSYDDVKKVVDFFFDKHQEKDLQIAMTKTTPQGDPEVLVETFLEDWIKEDPKNRAYVDTLKLAFREGAKARGYKEETPSAPAPETANAAAQKPADTEKK